MRQKAHATFFFTVLVGLLLLLATQVKAHSWYSGTRSPQSGTSCCGGNDCGPLLLEEISEDADNFIVTPTYSRQYLVQGLTYIFPKKHAQPTKHWHPDDPNDSGWHACVGSSGKPLCFFFPQGA
jgi:hypothetical protein